MAQSDEATAETLAGRTASATPEPGNVPPANAGEVQVELQFEVQVEVNQSEHASEASQQPLEPVEQMGQWRSQLIEDAFRPMQQSVAVTHKLERSLFRGQQGAHHLQTVPSPVRQNAQQHLLNVHINCRLLHVAPSWKDSICKDMSLTCF